MDHAGDLLPRVCFPHQGSSVIKSRDDIFPVRADTHGLHRMVVGFVGDFLPCTCLPRANYAVKTSSDHIFAVRTESDRARRISGNAVDFLAGGYLPNLYTVIAIT